MIKKNRPTTPSRRHMTGISYKSLLGSTKNNPHKLLTKGFKRSKGRNNKGRITTRHKGGGAKRLYRVIDFKYDKMDIPAKVESVEYDPNRSGFIALIAYVDGEKRYILAPQEMKKGDKIVVSKKAEIKKGNRLPLSKIPAGTHVYNIEVQPGGGAKLARSAGNFAELLAHDAGYAQIKMPSKEIRKVSEKCWASVGAVSNEEYGLIVWGKAGRSRHRGIRPTVRGSAMNAADHPLGGGEGRAPAGLKKGAKNKWGKGKRGVKTRKPKKYSNAMIIKRRIKKKRK